MKKKANNSFTARDVADWMLKSVLSEGDLYQRDAVDEIEEKFGESFVYDNERGNPAISRDVLDEFRKISSEQVVWVQSERYWRKRESEDDPGRRQDG